jgi:dipeptidyl aminopeptidase/acylaminoacyl peptidase
MKPGFDHIFVVDASGGAARQLTFGGYHDAGPLAWTPDGRQLLFSTVRKGDWQRDVLDSDIYALDIASGRIDPLTDRKGPDTSPAISPDGRQIAYLGYDDVGKGFDQSRLYVMNRDGSGRRQVATGLDRSIDQIEWARDGRSLYAAYEKWRETRRGSGSTVASTVATGPSTAFTAHTPAATQRVDQWVVADRDPHSLPILPLPAAATRKLTHLNDN